MTAQALSLVQDPATYYRRIAETINQIINTPGTATTILSGNNIWTGSNTFNGTQSIVGVAPNQVFVYSAAFYETGSTCLSLRLFWEAPTFTACIKIATLPISTAGTLDSLNIRATINTSWGSAGTSLADIVLGNRNAFSFFWNRYGPAQTAVAIAAYAEIDGSVSIYAVGVAATFAYAYISIFNAGNGSTNDVVLFPNPSTVTTAPTGTLVFSTANEATYPPGVTSKQSGTFAITASGFASGGTGTAKWQFLNGEVTLFVPLLTGTSNAIGFAFTLPAAIQPSFQQFLAVPNGLSSDNSANITDCALSVNGANAQFFHNFSANGWTAAGTKASGVFTVKYLL